MLSAEQSTEKKRSFQERPRSDRVWLIWAYTANSSNHPDPTPSTIQRRPQFFSEYQRFLPLPIAVLA